MGLMPPPLLPFATEQAFYSYQIENSVWLDGAADYFSRTLGTIDDGKVYTFRVLVKRTKLGATQYLIGDAGAAAYVRFDASDRLEVNDFGVVARLTTRVFRDVASHYDILVRVDTTNGTAADRVQVWINGVRETVFTTNNTISLNDTSDIHVTGNAIVIGGGVASNYLGSYLSDIFYLDGVASTATNFGQFKSGIWTPRTYSGSYGSEGFHLDFADSADLGNDVSGNGNDWTPNSMSSANQSVDTPTNNYPILSAISANPGNHTLADGNLRIAAGTSNGGWTPGTVAFDGNDSDGYYWEATIGVDSGAGGVSMVGVASESARASSASVYPGNDTGASGLDNYGYQHNTGNKMKNGTGGAAYGTAYTQNDVIGVAVRNGKLYFAKNGTWQNSGDPVAETGAAYTDLIGRYVPIFNGGATFQVTANFGQKAFSYTPPTGFKTLAYTDMDDPPDEAFDHDAFGAVLYTGNGTAIGSGGKVVTGLGFEPDIVWIKGRSGATSYMLYDSLRGVTNDLNTDDASVEAAQAEGLVSFDADGFTLGSLAAVNTNTATYVAWCWKLGTAFSGSTGGAGTPKAYSGEYNLANGMAAIAYVGNGSAGHTIPLPSAMTAAYGAPKMVIVKNRDQADSWAVWHFGLTSAAFALALDANTVQASDSTVWNSTGPSSSVITLGTNHRTNANNEDYVAYVFWEVPGFSKMLVYEGNAATDGAFAYCRFRPGWVLLKNIDGADSWTLFDNERLGYNVDNNDLRPDTAAAEGTTDYLDLLSNGMKLRTGSAIVNANTMIGWAFAEQPGKYANAR